MVVFKPQTFSQPFSLQSNMYETITTNQISLDLRATSLWTELGMAMNHDFVA